MELLLAKQKRSFWLSSFVKDGALFIAGAVLITYFLITGEWREA